MYTYLYMCTLDTFTWVQLLLTLPNSAAVVSQACMINPYSEQYGFPTSSTATLQHNFHMLTLSRQPTNHNRRIAYPLIAQICHKVAVKTIKVSHVILTKVPEPATKEITLFWLDDSDISSYHTTLNWGGFELPHWECCDQISHFNDSSLFSEIVIITKYF